MKRLVAGGVFAGVVLVLGAATGRNAEDLVRQGNAAFDGGDHERALALYEQAETETTDPGLVAFNEGAALYRLGKYVDAEEHYLRCLEDASGPRRARVFYDLGNAIVQRARDNDARMLERAMESYKKCLAQPEVDPVLARDARHNLELATKLWLKARQAKKPSDPDAGDQGNPNPGNKNDHQGGPQHPGNDTNPGQTETKDHGKTETEPAKGPGQVTTQPPPPGVGTLPPIPDDENLVPLSPEETAAYLQQAAARITGERHEHERQMARPASRNMKNW